MTAPQPLWHLRVERESLRAPALRDKLRAALADALGIAPLQLEVEAGAVHRQPAKRDRAERERRQREAEAIIHNDPLVQELLAQFPIGAHRARFDQTLRSTTP